MNQPIVPIRASTQLFTEIEDIKNGVLLFANGSCSLIVAVSAVNFGLLSEKEQDAIIYAYAGLLNSLSFPIQILVQTRHKDISSYLQILQDAYERQKNPKLAESIKNYRLFVASTVKEKEVLDKKFYIIIPFSNLELGNAPSLLFGGKSKGLPYPKAYIIDKALTVLSPKRDHILRLLSRVGLKAYQLDSKQVVSLLFSVYNPGQPMPDVTQLVEDGIKTDKQ